MSAMPPYCLNHHVDGWLQISCRRVNFGTYIHTVLLCILGLLSASVTSGRGHPTLLSWVDPVLGNLGLPLLVGLGSTGAVRCWQTFPALAKFDRQASLGTGCCALP